MYVNAYNIEIQLDTVTLYNITSYGYGGVIYLDSLLSSLNLTISSSTVNVFQS